MPKEKLLYRDKDKLRYVGWIEDGIFFKRINPKIHLQRIWGNTPGIQKQIWDEVQHKVKEIRIFAGQKLFKISREVFNRYKYTKDYGHGAQYFVNPKYWEIINPSQLKLI